MVLAAADFFFEINLFIVFSSKMVFWNISRVPSRLDPDHARRVVGPDSGPNCLQR